MQVDDTAASVDTRPNDGLPAEVLDWSSISQQCVGNGCAETLPQGYSMALCPKCIQAMNNVSAGNPQQQGHGPSVRGWRPPAIPETPTPMPPMPMRMPSSPTKAMYSPQNTYPPGGARIRPLPVFRGPQMAQSPAIQHRGPHGMPQNQPRFYPTRPKIVAPHFNARGEILEPPQYPQDLFPLYEPRRSMNAWPYPPTHPLRPRHPMRMCSRHGCGANIPPHSPSELCSRCITAIQAERHQHRAQMRVQTGESLKHNRLPGGTADAPIDIDMLDGTESKPQELRSHLPTPPTSSCSPTMPTIEIPEARKPTKPLPKKAPSVKLKLTIPRQHQDPSSSASASGSGSGYLPTPDTAPTAHNVPTPNASTSGYPLGRPKKLPREASCSTPGCAQPLEPDSVSGRCANCIRHHWKTRPERKLLRNLQRRKRVTWAEDVDGGDTALGGGDGGDGVTTDAEGEDGRMDVEESRSGSSTPISNDEGGIMGWDSDLTDLEEGAAGDSSDEAASEEEPGDLDEDVDEEEEVAAALQLTGLKIRIPRRVSVSEPGASSSITKIEPPPETLPSSSTTPEPPFTESAATSATTSDTPEPGPSISVTPELQLAEGPSTPPILCAVRSCSAPLALGYRWKSCISCRLRTREYQRKRQGITSRQIRLDGDTTATDFHPPHQHRPDELVPGARLCSIKRCIHVLPSKEEYRWKLCEGCRARMRNQARKRRRKEKAKEKKAALGESNATNMDVDSADDTDDSLGKPFHASPRSAEERENLPPGRCLSRDCGMLVPEDAPEPLCRQCRVRRGKPLKLKLKPPRDCMRNGVNTKPPPYPECQNSQTLISTFKHRLREFFHVQLLYLHLKSKKQQQMTDDEKAEGGKETKPIALDFRFAGEFSVVALDYEIEKRMDEVKERHAKIKDALAERTKLEFHPSMWISVMEDGGGIITRFVCIYASEQPALLADINPPTKVKAEEQTPEPAIAATAASPAPATTPQTPTSTISAFTPTIAGTTPATVSPSRTSPAIVTKPMRGELEIASFPDRTHLLFPGERTIVRFRLVG